METGNKDKTGAKLKRLPPYRRRQLRNSLWLISMRLKKITDALEGTPDGSACLGFPSGAHWEDRAEYHITNARMFLDTAEDLLLADGDEEGGA